MRRPERLIRLTKRLVEQPNQAFSLSDIAAECQAAKSSLSEDVALVRSVVAAEGAGDVETIAGAGGGVRYRAGMKPSARAAFTARLIDILSDPSRILPGGFLYMLDVLGDPEVLDGAGRIFASAFYAAGVNAVVTVETKGIPLAVATARYLHAPVVIVRREHRVTDGPALSLHYVSGSERRIQTMSVSTRAMPPKARVLIVDDFMRAGATVRAVRHLLAEFHAEVAGTAVFMATREPVQKLVDDVFALFVVERLEEGRPVVITAAMPWEGG
ncbi:pur operon repressor [Alicyclobacillus cellulosilyticus]|uniref:Pur operon repressor n=1 Tax=Alicyclobacillus cellulosilyticus TaxID=1003997 RepID=A0A917KEF3_9BACL|nr:pur operon repressor [Alicyclobacillus cellulosilyticus]GGJ08770.1 pur operon repressor [Alicyclobacillus cellulosilyticus]